MSKLFSLVAISSSELCILLNCSAQYVCKWEQGETRPRWRLMPGVVALRGLRKAQAAEVRRQRWSEYDAARVARIVKTGPKI